MASCRSPIKGDAALMDSIVNELADSVQALSVSTEQSGVRNLMYLPNRQKLELILATTRKVMFPGLFTDFQITDENIKFHLGMLLSELKALLVDQIARALAYERKDCSVQIASGVEEDARERTAAFMATLGSLRSMLLKDVEAAMRGDPAAKSHEEIILCYPGIEAVFVHRVAHELFRLKVPLIPRIMGELAHQRTAIDIHPGAEIGSSFFIDHGTGVVIGETTKIGNNVKLFHGVTLGALSTKDGQALAGKKRHPTIEDDVTIYAGAVILGGKTVIGKGSTIGGSVFVTQSVPPGNVVTSIQPELRLRGPSSRLGFESFDPGI
eukprot:RCo042343